MINHAENGRKYLYDILAIKNKGEKLTSKILDDLHCQFIRRLEKEGMVTLKSLHIDGTLIFHCIQAFSSSKAVK